MNHLRKWVIEKPTCLLQKISNFVKGHDTPVRNTIMVTCPAFCSYAFGYGKLGSGQYVAVLLPIYPAINKTFSQGPDKNLVRQKYSSILSCLSLLQDAAVDFILW